MKPLKSVATATTAITLAAVANPTVLAEELQTAPVAETTVTTNSQPTSSSEVKPALDAQAQVVASTQAEADAAQSVADDADKAVTDAQTAVADATKALDDAQAIADAVTPKAIEDLKADQATNADAQETNATETADVDAKIADQTKVVADTQANLDTAQASKDDAQAQADTADKTKADAQTAVDTAKASHADAQELVAKASPENIAANQADQSANLQDQADNARDTDAVNSNITAQTAVVTSKQSDVDSAQAVLDQANADVKAQQDAVTAAQDALNNTGLPEAQAKLDQAKQAVQTAQANVQVAQAALDAAKKSDAGRDDKLKAAQTDVNIKSDAVDTAKAKVAAATAKVTQIDTAVKTAQDAVKKAQDALSKVGKPVNFYEAVNAEIADTTGSIYFKDKTASLTAKMAEFQRLMAIPDKGVQAQDYAVENLYLQMAELYRDEASQNFVKTLVGDKAFNKTYHIKDGKLILSKEDYTALNIAFASQLNAFRKISGLAPVNQVTEHTVEMGMKAINVWNEYANKPENSDTPGSVLRHQAFDQVSKEANAYTENIYPTGGFRKESYTFSELNILYVDKMLGFAFKDAHANWGHYHNLLNGPNVLMGLYQNNVGGAYMTHSYSSKTDGNDVIIYGQNDKLTKEFQESFENINSQIELAKNYILNDLELILLVQEAAKYHHDIQKEYRETNITVPEKQAELDRLVEKAKNHAIKNNAPTVKLTQDVVGYNQEWTVGDILMPRGSWYFSFVKRMKTGEIVVEDDINLQNSLSSVFNDRFGASLRKAQSIVDKHKALYEPFFEKLKVAEGKNSTTALQATLTQAQSNLTQAQTASTKAKAELTKASSDYATALDLKTQAEKVLTDAMATPLQTQVAENNLRLATIALQNAQTRQAEAQQAVDNFSGDIVTKQAKLAEVQTALTTSQATQARATQDLATAKSALATAQAELDALTAEKAELLAEKDRLVEEAKALAEELNGYTNADSNLDNAKSALDAANATLAHAKLDAEAAHKKVDAINARLTEQKAKLAELQAQYDKLTAEEDARLNQGGTRVDLPDGGSVVVGGSGKTTPKLEPGQMLNPDGTITYSRKARQAALPNTGEHESLLALFGVAMLSSLGLAGGRRRRKG